MTGLVSPALALGAVLSTAFAALFHMWQRGNVPALRRFIVAAWLGFAGGHFLGDLAGFQWLQIGQLNVLAGTVGTVVVLLIANSMEA